MSPLLSVQRAARTLTASGIKSFVLEGDWDLEKQWRFYQGSYEPTVPKLIAYASLPDAEQRELNNRILVSHWVRETINQTPEELSPVILAQKAADFIESMAPGKVQYQIIEGEQLAEQGWVGVYGVGRGSERPPALLKLDFIPDGADDSAPVAALVGKGITFDSGGYSIKSNEGMLHMKVDMGGAATVTGGLALAIGRGLNKRVQLILCCAENLISGHAYKLGDILTYKNGTTVEIHNTDAEGRLVLADGLMMAGESGAPLIIDAATLTGAAVMALGEDYHALFSLDDGLANRFLEYADAENEPHWRLPLMPFHKNKCPSNYADTANSRAVKGGGPGGASNAAGFLARFVPNDGKGWLHIDLAGVMRANATSDWGPGATGMGIRAIARTLMEND